MNATITTNHGTLTGRSVETIIRREYGPRSTIRWSHDASSPDAGLIVEPARESYSVLATLISYEGTSETRDGARAARAEDEEFLATPAGARALAGLDADWDAWDAMHEDND
jgi:hypothetical protein